MMKNKPNSTSDFLLRKTPTGIKGLDEIISGGVPTGRPTLISGCAGCGKTMMALEFLVRGAMQFDENGIFMMFEENAAELITNAYSLGFNLEQLVAEKKIMLDYVHIERNEIEETGEYDLEGLFIRLRYAIESIGAKRVVLDTIEALFAGFSDEAILRAELRRLFRWLKNQGMTALITGEKGELSVTRYGLEEYVADCVILLDHRVSAQISTRRLRVMKYRGSAHGTNEYPFIIGQNGISVFPITSLRLDHPAISQRISTGIPELDEMLGAQGVYRGSSILITGTPGTGKTSIVAKFCENTCLQGQRAILFGYEESSAQILRNMRSVGIDLQPHIDKDLLQIQSSRPSLHGLEQHLLTMQDLVQKFQPSVVVIDPISNLSLDNIENDAKPTLIRLIDFFKQQQITTMYTSLVSNDSTSEPSQFGVSSLMDTWLQLRNSEFNGERNRTIFVQKSRGMVHSNQVREFVLSDQGIRLISPYVGADQVLTGTARVAQEAIELAKAELRRQDHERRLRQLASKQKTISAQIAALQAEAEAEADEVNFAISYEQINLATMKRDKEMMNQIRGGKANDLSQKQSKKS